MASDMVKVALTDDDGQVETLWATPVGGDRYRLENVPFFKYGVSWHDVVEAPLDEDGRPSFQSVAEKSGHRTVRVMLDDLRSPEATSLLDGLNKLGCSYEGAFSKLVTIDVPPEAVLDDVARFLIDAGANWEHADPTYEELFREAEPQKLEEDGS